MKKPFTPYPSPNTLKKMPARTATKDRMLPPPEKNWNSFFMSDQQVTEDFMTERAPQIQPERKDFDA